MLLDLPQTFTFVDKSVFSFVVANDRQLAGNVGLSISHLSLIIFGTLDFFSELFLFKHNFYERPTQRTVRAKVVIGQNLYIAHLI